jgi:Rrf2 family nitric oxide-sensitive transcriptional repressor
MKLNQFTDYGLRILMYISRKPSNMPATTITELSERFGISRNHVAKVVQFLSNNKIIDAQRGRGGGLYLSDKPEIYKIGDLICLLEMEEELVGCDKPPCILADSCGFNSVLRNALLAFYDYLNQYTLKDISKPKVTRALDSLIKDR